MGIKVAIAGSHGFLFEPVANAFRSPLFRSSFDNPVVVLTTSDPKTEAKAEGLVFTKVNYDDSSSLTSALKGIDVVVNLLGTGAGASGAWDKLAEASAANGVKIYFTSDFGCNYEKLRSTYPTTIFDSKAAHAEKARELGIKKVIQVYNGLLGFFFVDLGFFGFKPGAEVATFVGSGDQTINMTDLRDVGLAVASLASKADDYASLPDTVSIAGDTFSLKDSIKIYEKLSGKSIKITAKDPLPIKDFIADVTQFPVALLNLQAYPETNAFSFEPTENSLVNPGLWNWTTLEKLYKEKL
ncbi:hypothetical protein V1511DRAFT_3474 [Dipodascopsis uninucleata]